MKVVILADSQEEFDSKRSGLVKAIAGESPLSPKLPYFKAQGEMLDYWDGKFRRMLSDLRKDIDEIVDNG